MRYSSLKVCVQSLCLSLLGGSLLALPACAVTQAEVVPRIKPDLAEQRAQIARFENWKQDFIRRAITKGYSEPIVKSVMDRAKFTPIIIERNNTQPEFTKPVWSYVDNAVSATRLANGRKALNQSQTNLAAVETRYQVSRYILTAIWGLESAYGQIMGTRDVVSGLSTLAFEGRRTEFGETQLFALLDMVQSGAVRPEQLIGSWAGAMGMTQFTPTTFRDYAVDFDGNGNKDLWRSEGDALGSAAHYLARSGWQWNAPAFIEVSLPDDFDYQLSDGRKKSLNGWAGAGVQALDRQAWNSIDPKNEAKLLVLAGHQGAKFLTFKNFDVIKRYNNSTSYALGIAALAKTLEGGTAIRTAWPRGDKPLTRTQIETLQRRLTEKGFSTGGVDGRMGPMTRAAIRAWQQANGLPADGYAEHRLYNQIIKG